MATGNKQYLTIFEDFNIRLVTEITEGDLDACRDGYLTIIDITIPSKAKILVDDEWHDVNKYYEESYQ